MVQADRGGVVDAVLEGGFDIVIIGSIIVSSASIVSLRTMVTTFPEAAIAIAAASFVY